MTKLKPASSAPSSTWLNLLTGEPMVYPTRRPRPKREARPVQPAIAVMPTGPMLDAAANKYHLSVIGGDSPKWAVVCIYKALRYAASSASGCTRVSRKLHTSEPLHIRTVQQRRPRRRNDPPVEVALPVMLTETMLYEAADAYQRCVTAQYSARRAAKRIYKVLRHAALNPDE
jgi:hypothetical protein